MIQRVPNCWPAQASAMNRMTVVSSSMTIPFPRRTEGENVCTAFSTAGDGASQVRDREVGFVARARESGLGSAESVNAPRQPAPSAAGGALHGSRVEQILGRTRLFRGVSPSVIERVAAALRPLDVAAGDTIVNEGDPADRFYIVGAGTVVGTGVFSGQERELGRLGPGGFFGEIALMQGGSSAATMRAETPVQLLTLTKDEFSALMEQVPALASAVREAAQARKAERVAGQLEVEHHNIAKLLEQSGQIKIGRSEDNDLVFPAPSVSRQHAVIRLDNGRCRLTDLEQHRRHLRERRRGPGHGLT